MPHAILQSQMTIEEIASKFEGFEDKSETVNVRFINLFRDGNRPSLLIDTYINETPYPQRLGLVIHEREPHSFIIQLHELGFPRITDGVHSAVGFLTKWLASQPDTTLQTHNLNNFK